LRNPDGVGRAGCDAAAVAFKGGSLYRHAMMRFRLCVAGALSLAAVIAAVPVAMSSAMSAAHAANPKKEPAAPASATAGTSTTEALGTVGAWAAYASRDKMGRVCYLVGQPQKSDSAGIARKSPAAMVTHRPTENITNVVSFVEGYPLKEASEVGLEIGDRKFDLFTKDDSAWARTAELDRTIVALLAKGKSAVVKGTPQKGKATTDTYALAGFTKALALIDKACGVKRAETAAPRQRPKKARPAKQ
jgi:hypothetical protein